MDNQTKIIFVLLAIILVLVGIFVLKATGVIKPAEKEIVNVLDTSEEVKNNEKEMLKKDISFSIKLYNLIEKYAKTIIIVICILNIILAIGMAKLYSKIDMPDWAISFQYIYPIINILLSFGGGTIVKIIELIISLISLSCLCCFFGCLNMSQWWPLSIILGIVFITISAVAENSILLIVGIVLVLLYLYVHIISSIKLVKLFDKGIAFLLLLIILPGIFQPVLGFENKKA